VLDETGPVREATGSLLNAFRGVLSTADEVAATWNGLGVAYSAPEAPVVLAAMARPGVCAHTLAGHAETACAALMVYADRLDELKMIREQLTADIATHEAKAAATSQDSTQSDDPIAQQHQQNLLHSEAVALEGRVARFVQALEEAQQECSSKIHAAQGGATHVGGGVATLTGGGPGLIPIEPDPRVWDVGQARDGRFRSGTNQEEHHESSGAMGLGAPVPGESAPMPRPDPWQYPGDSEGEGSGPHSQRGANLGDHLKHEAATSAAYGMAPFWPDASRNLFHFLNNSGKPLDMNTNGMLNDLPSLQGKVNIDLKDYTSAALKDAKTSGYTEPVTYPFVTGWQDEYAEKSENANWFYATGGYQHATAGTITVYPDGSYKYAYQVHTADRYNWDGDKKTGIGPLTIHDTELQELHRAGIAQEFDLVGESSVRTGP
jgi:hypothetical protein